MPEDAAITAVAGVSGDPWLSGLLGWRVLRVDAAFDAPASALHRDDERVFAWTKVGIHDVERVAALSAAGFRVVDVALTFRGDMTGAGDAPCVRAATPEDRDRVVEVAETSFRYSRFHADPRVPDAMADRIKASWTGNWFAGQRGDAMLVAERDGRVVGFAQLLHAGDGATVIDLVAVEAGHQGQGLGSELVRATALHGAARPGGSATVVVGTQAANRTSVRLYESHGLRLDSAQYVLHYHGGGESTD